MNVNVQFTRIYQMIVAAVCKKTIYELSLPDELIEIILSYCSWKTPPKSIWYIISSKIDPSCLVRAKRMDEVLLYLASDEEEDCYTVFKRHMPDMMDYVNHIYRNRTV